MNFEQLLISAKNNEPKSKQKVFDIYRPLLIKEALIDGRLEEDLYQELQEILLLVVRSFNF